MMISDLPQDLLEEILSRVPTIFVKRLRSTCKPWRDLFNDQIFIAKHYCTAEKESMALMLTTSNVIPIRVNLNPIFPSIEFEGALSLTFCADFATVFHCDGLLLCTTMDKRRLMVCNPCLGEPMWIKLDSCSCTNPENWFGLTYKWFGLGYEEKNAYGRSYKILMKPCKHEKYKIYDFSSDSWRVLDDVVLDDCMISSFSVSFKGNIYWYAHDEKDKFLLSFDFTVERYKRLGLPQELGNNVGLSIVGEKQLLMLSWSNASLKVDIWETNVIDSDIETTMKWTKSFSFSRLSITSFELCVPVWFNYLFEEEKKLAVYCMGEVLIHVYIIGEKKESYREICAEPTFQGLPSSTIIDYVPTLAQVRKGVSSNTKEALEPCLDEDTIQPISSLIGCNLQKQNKTYISSFLHCHNRYEAFALITDDD